VQPAAPPVIPTLNIFSVASGHLYERFLRMMMHTVIQSSKDKHGVNTRTVRGPFKVVHVYDAGTERPMYGVNLDFGGNQHFNAWIDEKGWPRLFNERYNPAKQNESVEESYRGVLLLWHGPNLLSQYFWPKDTPAGSPTMVTLVHRQFGTMWHDEVGYDETPQHPHDGHDAADPKEQSGQSWQQLFGTGSKPKEFYIRVYTEDEMVKMRFAKQDYPHYFELAVEEMLEPGHSFDHGSVAATLRLNRGDGGKVAQEEQGN